MPKYTAVSINLTKEERGREYTVEWIADQIQRGKFSHFTQVDNYTSFNEAFQADGQFSFRDITRPIVAYERIDDDYYLTGFSYTSPGATSQHYTFPKPLVVPTIIADNPIFHDRTMVAKKTQVSTLIDVTVPVRYAAIQKPFIVPSKHRQSISDEHAMDPSKIHLAHAIDPEVSDATSNTAMNSDKTRDDELATLTTQQLSFESEVTHRSSFSFFNASKNTENVTAQPKTIADMVALLKAPVNDSNQLQKERFLLAIAHSKLINSTSDLVKILAVLADEYRILFATHHHETIKKNLDFSRVLRQLPENQRLSFAEKYHDKIQTGLELLSVSEELPETSRFSFIQRFPEIIKTTEDIYIDSMNFSNDEENALFQEYAQAIRSTATAMQR